MRCSVIIPTLNEASTIEATLRRLEQMAPHEIIVSDGDSTDPTAFLAARHATVVKGARERGPQLNAGAIQATGDTLLFLHADVRIPRRGLVAIESALRHPDIVGGHFRVRFGPSPHEAFVAACYQLLRMRGAGIVYGDATIFVRREAFRALGGFRDYPIMEDVNFVSRMRGLGRVVELKEYVVPSSRRWDNGGVWTTWASWWALQLMYGVRVSPYWLGRLYRSIR